MVNHFHVEGGSQAVIGSNLPIRVNWRDFVFIVEECREKTRQKRAILRTPTDLVISVGVPPLPPFDESKTLVSNNP